MDFRLYAASQNDTGPHEVIVQSSVHLPDDLDPRVKPLSCLVRRFLDWIEKNKPTAPSFKDGLRVQILLDAAQCSDREERKVQVTPK